MSRRSSQRSGFTRKWLMAMDKHRKPFDDELFNTTFSQENIVKLLGELKTITETKVAESHRLVDEDYPYTIQLNSFVRPHLPIHLLRIQLPHSVLGEDSQVLVFVKDVKRIVAGRAKIDHDHTIKHYESLFKAKKIDLTNITFMPITQLLNEYPTYDQRRKLTFLYEKFLVDKQIGAKVNAFIGSKIMLEGRGAFPVDLSHDDLPNEVNAALCEIYYQYPFIDYVNNKPNIKVGRHNMDHDKMAENIIDLVGQIGSLHPGGSQNIQRITIRAARNVSTYVELYASPDLKACELPAEDTPMEGDNTAQVDQVTEPTPTRSHFIVCVDHFILFEEDDYSRENEERAHFDKGSNDSADGRNRTSGGQYNSQGTIKAGAKRNSSGVAVGNGGTGGGGGGGGGNNSSGNDINAMVMKSLQKLLGQQNLPSLMNSSGGGGGGGGNRSGGGQRNRREIGARNGNRRFI